MLSKESAVIYAWDNINWFRHAAQSRNDSQGVMVNATTRTLIIPRYIKTGLSRNPQRDVSELTSLDILPKMEDYGAIFNRRIVFVARFMIDAFPSLNHLKDKIPNSWISRSPKLVQPTRVIPLSMLHFNEGTIDGTLNIFDQLAEELHLSEKERPTTLLCAGDQSSCKTARAAKRRRRWEATDGNWVEGLQWVLEWPQHFHCQLAYLRVWFSAY